MNAAEFVRKWAAAAGRERASAQEHFLDICHLLGEKTPTEADPSGDIYTFEAGARTADGQGFADVWLKDHFAWEYKGKRKDLGAAYRQVNTYREALGNPPLLVVCDFERFEVHTNWTNTEKWVYVFTNEDIATDSPVTVETASGVASGAPSLTALQVLKTLFAQPDVLRPNKTREDITREAAALFGEISESLRKWKVDDMRIARFVSRVLFCMFATDVGLLPRQAFTQVIDTDLNDNAAFRRHLAELFQRMNTGGEFALQQIRHFNGRLFEDDDVPEYVTTEHILILKKLDDLNWSDVEPAIFGTFFERILDPKMRQKLGAHYTSRADIELIVEPVLMDPLRREWEEVKKKIDDLLHKESVRQAASPTVIPAKAGIQSGAAGQTPTRIRPILAAFLKRLSSVTILDPACGSGNFLYVSLDLLKGLEKEVLAYAAIHEVSGLKPVVHPRQLRGIHDKSPREPDWPDAEFIVGNPPFLGGKMLRKNLGDDYVDALFAAWDGHVARESDLCCYWFEKARSQIQSGRAKRAGLLATQGIRGGANRKVLERIKESGDIFYAQADRKWIQDGVAVRVSMVGFDDGTETRRRLNPNPDDIPEGALDRALAVEGINANLTSRTSTAKAPRLRENLGISFMGITKVGAFDIDGGPAQKMLRSPNPNGLSNADVVRPWVHGRDLNQRRRDSWIIDFPPDMTEQKAALYEAPFEYVVRHVKRKRLENKRASDRIRWWVHHRPRPAMRNALLGLQRYIATSMVAKHRIFVWLPPETLAENVVIVFARDDDFFFGVLHSRPHELWGLAQGTQLESRPRYTPTTCFETFPFPRPTDAQREAIAAAACELNGLRERWLNPEPVDHLPLPEKELKKRTLTNLYNERPTWLANAHAALDAAVFAAYGWPPDISDEEILARLLALNHQREPA